jgi:hypothetical protein
VQLSEGPGVPEPECRTCEDTDQDVQSLVGSFDCSPPPLNLNDTATSVTFRPPTVSYP